MRDSGHRSRLRDAWREVHRRGAPDRYIDATVKIHVVRRDLAGVEVISGLHPVSSIRSHWLGGIWDSVERRWCGRSEHPKIWYSSDVAIDSILHPGEWPRGVLAHGAMGAGKTRLLAQWIIARTFDLAEHAPIEGGLTAPTDARLEAVIGAMRELMRPEWWEFTAHSRLFTMAWGVSVRCIGTARRSKDQGSRIQGYNWAFHGGDELQDSVDEHGNIEARGRRAPSGIYRRLATVTAKESSSWRTLRTQLLGSGQWREVRVALADNPFVWPRYVEDLRGSLSEREFKQKVLAEYLGPERAVYPGFSREYSIRPRPRVGGKDVTFERVGAHGLIGHDPGASTDVSLLLKCYRIGHKLDVWWVVDEWTTTETTTQEHALRVRRDLREKWELQWPEEDSPKVIVRCDPQGETDNRTSESVYKTWRLAGFQIKSAAYNKSGEPRGILNKEAGIEMVNRLLKSARGEHRLLIDCDDRGVAVAPRLVEALEMSERDERDRAETAEKGSRSDLSHWCASLRYALWPYERLRDVTVLGRGKVVL